MPKLFWCWVGGWFGKVCHEVGGFGGSLMVWHSWATWFVMSSYVTWHGTHGIHVGGLSCHGMTCMEYMSGACHVRAWHGMYGKHVGGLSCHGMTWNTCQGLVMLGHGMARMEYMSGIAMSWHAWNTCRGLPCHHASMLPCHVQWFKSWAVQPNTSAELWPD
jgi:hypothetical protein